MLICPYVRAIFPHAHATYITSAIRPASCANEKTLPSVLIVGRDRAYIDLWGRDF